MRFRLKVVEAVRSNVCSVDADDDDDAEILK